MTGQNLSGVVSTRELYRLPAEGERIGSVAVLDLGVKRSTLQYLAARGLEVIVVPQTITAPELLALQPTAVFFSNGPGDPSASDAHVELLRVVLREGVPFFGICFGNQLLGRALGFGTYKLPFGHRGINQPVLDRGTGRIEVTSHNHGFAVDAPVGEPVESPEGFGRVRVSHVNLNDDVVEGLEALDIPAFSVQYHPEAAAGPHDSNYLFDRFADSDPQGQVADAQARRHQVRPGDRIRPDRHRAGVRVRLLGHAGVPSAARGGHPRHPHQLQPGDDHDRPRLRRRDLHRADHLGGDRDDHREGAARRDPGRRWAARPRSTRRSSCTSTACWRSTASS